MTTHILSEKLTFSRGSHAMYDDGYRAHSPASIFTSNEPGAWYDPSDFDTMFQDSAGLTAITSPAQSIGLILDKSKQSYFAPRRNRLDYSEDFSNLSWTKENTTIITNAGIAPDGSTTACKLTSAATGTISRRVWQASSMTTGLTYTGSFYAKAAEISQIGFDVGQGYANVNFNLANGTYTSLGGAAPVSASITSVGSGWYLCTLVANLAATGSRQNSIYLSNVGNSTTVPIGNGVYLWGAQVEIGAAATSYQATTSLPVSWNGNHATQTSAASRPVFGRNPVTGTRNQFIYTEQLNNAAWAKSGVSITSDAATAPDGTTTADLIIPSATSTSFKQATQSFNYTLNTNYTFSGYFKAGAYKYIQIITSATPFGASYINYDLSTGTETAYGVPGSPWNLISKTITSLGNGWYRIAVTLKCTATASGNFTFNPIPAADSPRGVSWAGDGTSGLYVWGQQIEVGSVTNYQRVVSSLDVTESGIADCYYLQFDGSDDFLVTPTITPGTDKAQVFAGVRKLSDAAAGTIIESSANYGLNDGAIIVLAPTTDLSGYRFGSSGSIRLSNANTIGFTSPITNVLTGIGDIAADTAILRVNGTQVASSSSDQGTGNYLAYPAYIGRRAGTSLPFNGRIYNLVLRFGSNLSNTKISEIETWVNRKTGAY